jgi:hypothetical protein
VRTLCGLVCCTILGSGCTCDLMPIEDVWYATGTAVREYGAATLTHTGSCRFELTDWDVLDYSLASDVVVEYEGRLFPGGGVVRGQEVTLFGSPWWESCHAPFSQYSSTTDGFLDNLRFACSGDSYLRLEIPDFSQIR